MCRPLPLSSERSPRWEGSAGVHRSTGVATSHPAARRRRLLRASRAPRTLGGTRPSHAQAALARPHCRLKKSPCVLLRRRPSHGGRSRVSLEGVVRQPAQVEPTSSAGAVGAAGGGRGAVVPAAARASPGRCAAFVPSLPRHSPRHWVTLDEAQDSRTRVCCARTTAHTLLVPAAS